MDNIHLVGRYASKLGDVRPVHYGEDGKADKSEVIVKWAEDDDQRITRGYVCCILNKETLRAD